MPPDSERRVRTEPCVSKATCRRVIIDLYYTFTCDICMHTHIFIYAAWHISAWRVRAAPCHSRATWRQYYTRRIPISGAHARAFGGPEICRSRYGKAHALVPRKCEYSYMYVNVHACNMRVTRTHTRWSSNLWIAL